MKLKPLGLGDQVFTYDACPNGVNRICETKTSKLSETFAYDPMGRLTNHSKVFGKNVYRFQYAYDSSGRITTVQMPRDFSLQYKYDGPFLARIESSVGLISEYLDIDARGRPTAVRYGNGVVEKYSFYGGDDHCSKDIPVPCRIAVLTADGKLRQDLRYEFDRKGNVISREDKLSNKTTYGYDDLDRLTEVHIQRLNHSDRPSEGPPQAIRFEYDRVGNMLFNSLVGTYKYSQDGNQSHAVRSAGVHIYSYDENGNLSSSESRTLSSDINNHIVLIKTARHVGGVLWPLFPRHSVTEFEYDWKGRRIEKSTSRALPYPVTFLARKEKERYVDDGFECDGDECRISVFVGSHKIATVNVKSKRVDHYHSDLIDSRVSVSDKRGQLIRWYAYLPFGSSYRAAKSTLRGASFTGQALDRDTGLYYYRGRYYDPEIGKFTSPDRRIGALEDPQSLNSYAYVLNNPATFNDPSGQEPASANWRTVEKFATTFVLTVGIFAAATAILPEVAGAAAVTVMGVQVAAVMAATGAFVGTVAGSVIAASGISDQGALEEVVETASSFPALVAEVGAVAAGQDYEGRATTRSVAETVFTAIDFTKAATSTRAALAAAGTGSLSVNQLGDLAADALSALQYTALNAVKTMFRESPSGGKLGMDRETPGRTEPKQEPAKHHEAMVYILEGTVERMPGSYRSGLDTPKDPNDNSTQPEEPMP